MQWAVAYGLPAVAWRTRELLGVGGRLLKQNSVGQACGFLIESFLLIDMLHDTSAQRFSSQVVKTRRNVFSASRLPFDQNNGDPVNCRSQTVLLSKIGAELGAKKEATSHTFEGYWSSVVLHITILWIIMVVLEVKMICKYVPCRFLWSHEKPWVRWVLRSWVRLWASRPVGATMWHCHGHIECYTIGGCPIRPSLTLGDA